jgi:hypothetical protein
VPKTSLVVSTFLTLALTTAAAGAKNPPPRVVLPALEWENAPSEKFLVKSISRIETVGRLSDTRVTGEPRGDFRPERFLGQEVSFLLSNPPEDVQVPAPTEESVLERLSRGSRSIIKKVQQQRL